MQPVAKIKISDIINVGHYEYKGDICVFETGALQCAQRLKMLLQGQGFPGLLYHVYLPMGRQFLKKCERKLKRLLLNWGYSPNALASSLTTGRTKLIGLVSNNFHNPLFLEVFDLFTKGLQERGLRPLIVNLSDENSPENSVRLLKQYSVDGVVVASSTLSPSFAKAFRDAQLPVVHCFGKTVETPQVHVVGIDNIEAGKMATKVLIDRGYKNIGFMGGPIEATSTQDRLSGFLSAVKDQSGVTYSHSFAAAYSFDAGRIEMKRLLKTERKDAYFCGDDVLSIGALSAIKEAGLKVPHDIGIIGFNDMEMAGWEYINLTTIHQPILQIVNSSIELIEAMLDDRNSSPESKLFPCHLAERGTLRANKL